MSHSSKLMVMCLAAVAMAVGVTSASARNLSLSHTSWRAVFNPLRFSGSGITIDECRVTLEGNFHTATIAKVERTLIGFINEAAIAGCTRPTTVLRETLPWHIQYGGFTGTLPEISGVRLRLINASFRISEIPLFGSCLARSETGRPAIGIANIRRESYVNGNGIVSSLRAEEGAGIPCGGLTGNFSGVATVQEVPGGAENLLLRLI